MAEVELTLPCSKCKQTKPISAFRRRPDRPKTGKRKGRWSFCRDCERAWQASPRGREVSNAATDRFRKKLRDTNLEELRRRERASNLKRLYGLTDEEYQARLADQNGVCAICGRGDPGGRWSRRFHIDHNHTTGAIRGILCHGCNIGIGAFEENIESLELAIAYLKRFKEI